MRAPDRLDALAQLGEEGGRDDFGATATAALGSDPDRERGERGRKGERGSVLGFARGREGNLIRAGRRRMAATAPLPPVARGGRQVGVGLGRFARWAKGPSRLGFFSFY